MGFCRRRHKLEFYSVAFVHYMMHMFLVQLVLVTATNAQEAPPGQQPHSSMESSSWEDFACFDFGVERIEDVLGEAYINLAPHPDAAKQSISDIRFGSDTNGPVIFEGNARDSQLLVTWIANILVREILGYETYMRYSPNTLETFERLSSSSELARKRPTHANLEVWSSVLRPEVKKWANDAGEVRSVGAVGYAGRGGWYTDSHSTGVTGGNDSPPCNIRYWECLKDKGTIQHFSMSAVAAASASILESQAPVACESDVERRSQHFPDAGCVNGAFVPDACLAGAGAGSQSSCAPLIALTPEHHPGILQAQIERLGLNVSIPFMGVSAGEAFVAEQLDLQQGALLFYHYTPSILLHEYQERVQRIAFPEPTASCFVSSDGTPGNGPDCDFPFEILEKYVHGHLEAEAPEVHHLLRHLHLSDADMVWLFGEVRNSTTGVNDGNSEGFGLSGEDSRGYLPPHFQAACRWVKGNPNVWSSWLDENIRFQDGDNVASDDTYNFEAGIGLLAALVVCVVVLAVLSPRILSACQKVGRIGISDFTHESAHTEVFWQIRQHELHLKLTRFGSFAPDESYEVDFNEVELLEYIGGGSFGEVRKGRWKNTYVAVKTLKGDHSNKVLSEFTAEAAIMGELHHPNIALLMGYSRVPPALILEYLVKGSLWNLIHEKEIPMTSHLMMHVLVESACGMGFLHGHNPPITHADLKTPNVLVDATWRCKIADFGLSTLSSDGRRAIGTVNWSAPEIFKGGSASMMGDVYAFGVTIFEVAYRKKPFHGNRPVDFIDAGAGPLVNSKLEQDVLPLMRKCWDQNPQSRPTFSSIS